MLINYLKTWALGLVAAACLVGCSDSGSSDSSDATGSTSPPTIERSLDDRVDLFSSQFQIHPIYAVPQDQVDEMLDTNGTISGSLKSTNAFFSLASGGKQFRFDMTLSNDIDLSFIRLPGSDAEYASNGLFAREAIQADVLAAGFDDSKKLYLVYYGGTNSASCGSGAPLGSGDSVAVLYLKGAVPNQIPCGDTAFSSESQVAGYWEWAAAHEIVHTLGFVDPCATHYNASAPAHVGDDPRDLMYAGSEPWVPSIVDVGQDDYFGASVPSECTSNLFNSAFLFPQDGNQVPVNFHH